MDKTTQQLVDYTQSFSLSDLTPAVRDAARDRLFDTISVAIAGSDTEPALITARLASRIQSEESATIFGFGVSSSPELVALANTIMVRTYDYNDGGGGHPSDMISGVLAAGEVVHASGLEVLGASALAYEINGALNNAADPYEKGFDQGMYPQLAVALVAGKLWRFNTDQLANAASLALVPNLPLRIAREGELSMMKGSATAFAVRNGVFAAMLARDGFTSSPEAFEGFGGLWGSVTGPFKFSLPVEPDGMRIIQKTTLKAVPTADPILGLMELIPKVRNWTTVDDIESIEVEMAERFAEHLADEAKYDPQTRETADHSVPYLIASALLDGPISFASYRAERMSDPKVRALMKKITVKGSPNYTKLRKQKVTIGTTVNPASLRVRARSGKEFFEESMTHKGDLVDPMTRADMDAKFDAICKGVLSQEQKAQVRSAWWDVAQASDIGPVIQTLTGFRQL